MKKLYLLILIMSVSCSFDEDTVNPNFCTEDFRAGLEVTVKDQQTGRILVDSVIVVVKDGSYTETLKNFENTNTFTGAFERKGTYIITVSKMGYKTYVSDPPIVVDEDLCHVITEKLNVVLQK